MSKRSTLPEFERKKVISNQTDEIHLRKIGPKITILTFTQLLESKKLTNNFSCIISINFRVSNKFIDKKTIYVIKSKTQSLI
jgi:hypothetical protein